MSFQQPKMSQSKHIISLTISNYSILSLQTYHTHYIKIINFITSGLSISSPQDYQFYHL
ncbi:hypothetical protein CROQUDRAFT_99119 [Cronartium quercuum f. sp. fusiforme G11]|uniref:Uncharacterized protein n=1 Tax=Cronartium quercuum f. sp. fusiforme G11 TaxID=708437 RepID=A0A9P6T6M4_9BASI|nr:hypothetical protein CROQUDRAFT_99119 [Cronartium quercuum f. sp. fusiforme G11]